MAKVWLSCFILGALSGRAGLGAAFLAWTIVLPSRRWSRAVVASAAFLWGASHAAPPLDRNLPFARVVTGGPGDKGPLIVCAELDGCFETYGILAPGGLGAARIDSARIDSARIDSARIDSARIDSARIDSARAWAAPGATASDGGATASDGGPTASDGGPTASDGGPTASDGGATAPDLAASGGAAPSLFSRYHSMFHRRYAPGGAAPSLVSAAVTSLRAAFHRRMARRPPLLRAWFTGLVLGDKHALPHRVLAGFRALGLYHLLAVSGLHVTLACSMLAAVLRAPLQIAYALRFIGPLTWRRLAVVFRIGASVIAIFYLAVTGAPVAAQRSALVFVLLQLAPLFVGVAPAALRLQVIAVVQTLLFPVGFISEAVLMSWAAYLFLAAEGHAAVRQLKLMALVTAAFGQLSLLSLPANLLLVPAFGLLLATALLLVAFPTLPGAGMLLELHRSFLLIASHAGTLTEAFPWLAPAPHALPAPLRLGAAVLTAFFLLNTCRDLSIKPYEGD